MKDAGPTSDRPGPVEERSSSPAWSGSALGAEGIQLLDRPGISPNDPMGEAGRKVMRFHYRRMVYHEPGTRAGDDIEALHDMRVATRRMRAAFRVFGLYYRTKAIKPHLRDLRRTGQALGAVRDLDVFRAEVQAYRDRLPPAEQHGLDGLLGILEAQRAAARAQMVEYLDGDKYRRFVERFGAFVETEGNGIRAVELDGEEPEPYLVRHVAPVAVYDRWANVRAFDEWVRIPDPPLARLHALRIACKRLRYTLEFFQEVLGPATAGLVKDIVGLQDHLGALQDAAVASNILRAQLRQGERQPDAPTHRQRTTEGVQDPAALTTYLAAQQSTIERLLDTFPEAWQRLNEASFGQSVAEAVMVL